MEVDWLNFRIDEPTETKAAIENMLRRASIVGLSDSELGELRCIVQEFDVIFRLQLSPGPLVKVEPMKIKLTENAKPVRAIQRRYPHTTPLGGRGHS